MRCIKLYWKTLIRFHLSPHQRHGLYVNIEPGGRFIAGEVCTFITGEVYLAFDLLDAYLFSMIKRYSI